MVALFHRISNGNHKVGFLGRLTEGQRSLACCLREEAEGSAVQVVELAKECRHQIFIPQSAFGDRWEGIAMVLEGFAGTTDNRREEPCLRWPEKAIRVREVNIEKATMKVESNPKSNLMEVLGRCLVGRVGVPEGRKINIRQASEWMAKNWKGKRVEILELGGPYIGFIFPSKKMVEVMRTGRWFMETEPLFLDCWSPLGLCHCRKSEGEN